MADGSVKIDVGLNISKAEKDLAKLREKIAKTESQLNADTSRKSALEEQIREVGAQADEAKRKVMELKQQLSETRSRDEKASIREQLAEATEEERILTKESNRLNDEYVKVGQSIEKGTTNLTEMQQEAGELSQQIARAKPGDVIAHSLESARKSLMKFLKYAFGIRSVYFLFRRLRSAISESVKAYAEYDKELKTQFATMDAMKKTMQVAFGSVFAQIYQAILPALQKIVSWLVDAANAASRFIAIISGRSSYKKAVLDTSEVAASLEDTSDAADDVTESVKEAKKQLMGFDELNILSDDSGSSSGKVGTSKPGKTALDGVKVVDEPIDAFDGSFLSNLALSVKDVLFDWDDLNPEQIAQKAISGLSMLLGAGVGFMIGGVPGAIVGTLVGLTLSLIANSAIFDHDGVLDPNEVAAMIRAALAGLCGGVIGFAIGGPGGALIGATVGIGISLLASAIEPKEGEGGELGIVGTLVELLNYALPVAATTAFGFMVGGPGGAAIGFILGLGISLMIAEVDSIPGGGKDLFEKMIGLLNNDAVRSGIEFLGNPVGGLVSAIVRLSIKFKSSDDSDIASESREAGEEASENVQSGMEDGITRTRRDWGAIFRNLFGTATEDAIQTGEGIGTNVTEGEATGIENGTENVVDAAKEMDEEVQDQIRTDWDSHSPSKVSEEIAGDVTEGFVQGFNNHTPDVVSAAHSMFDAIYNEISSSVERIKAIMDFQWSLPRPRIPVITASYSNFSYGNGQSVSIPQFFVNWYARGGIFDFPQLIGVGENGKEAVVPLERNTEWMSMVADGIMERLEKAKFANQLAAAFVSMARPAMASGGIIPPNALSAATGGNPALLSGGSVFGEGGEDGFISRLSGAIYDAVRSAVGSAPSRGGNHVAILEVNGREFCRATYSDLHAVEKEKGVSLITNG